MKTTPTQTERLFLQGGGNAGSLMRSTNWAATSLGAPGIWPSCLRHAVRFMLDASIPMYIVWGPDFTVLYNDAYIPILGTTRHPRAMGVPMADASPTVWPLIEPLYASVMQGETVSRRNFQITLDKNGYSEACYFDFNYIPIRYDDGTVGGLQAVFIETTEKVRAIQRLEASTRQFHDLVMQAPVAIAVFRGAGFVAEIANDAYLPLVGKKRDEFIGKPLFESLPETKEKLEPLIKQVVETGRPFHAKEFGITINRSGIDESCYFNYVYEPLRESDGAINGFVAVAHEVTEQVQARKKVEESEGRLRSFVESAPFPIGVYTGKEMQIEVANQTMIDTWGKGAAVIGRRYTEVLPELDNQEIFKQLDHVYTTGIPFHAQNQRVDLVVNGRLQPFYFNYSFTPLYDASGRVYGVMNTGADVTDLNLTKQKLEESEGNLRNIILQAPVAMSILRGSDFVVEIANDRMLELWGKTGEALLHKPIFEGLHEAKGQGIEALLQNVYTTGKTFRAYGHPVNLPRGGNVETVYVNFVYEAFREADGAISGIMAVAIDVTSQVLARHKIEEVVAQRTTELAQANEALLKTNQELSRSNANLEEFAYAASHDLKEPVRKIHFFGDRLRGNLSNRLTDEESRLFDRMELAAKRMGSLIDDLLNYSQISLRPRTFETVDMNHLIDLVLGDLDLEIEEKGAAVTVAKLFTIRGHHRQLQQAFQNLIGNALKYSKPGIRPEIRITCGKVPGAASGLHLSPDEQEREYYVVQVADNGIGFEQKDADRIFNVFTRLHGNAEFRGTGIGLSIVRKVLENHHGYITAKGCPGEGATFKVYLPVT